ncbi:MAG: MFS transporter [Phycisphaeraceae bacterium]|nr:MFS transporter [Phycisphaeraceae bacterium]
MSDCPTPLWRHLSFTLMWTSTAASGFGDRMMMLAGLALLGGLAAGSANATAVQASTQFWFFLSYIILSVPGGWLADRLPRKWLLLACDESRGLILLLACYLLTAAPVGTPAAVDASHWWKIYGILLAVGCFAAIFNPTRNAIIPQIIPRPQLQPANAVILVINVIASMIGMLIGGLIISATSAASVRNGLILGAGFYLVSGTFFAFLRPTPGSSVSPSSVSSGGSRTLRVRSPGSQTPALKAQPPHETRSLMQVLRFAASHRRIAWLILLNVMVWSAAAVVSSALLGIGKHHYGLQGDALLSQFTQLSAMMGAGMLLGGVLIVLIRTRRESPIVIMIALAGAGACVLLLAVAPWRPASFLAALGIGVFGNLAIVAIMTLLQTLSPNYIRGRVMGLNSMVNTIASVSTYFAIWRLPDADVNIIIVLQVLGPLLLLVGIAGLWRHLRQGPLDRGDRNLLWHLARLLVLVVHRLRWHGRGAVPCDGPVMLVSNHTTGVDPLLIQASLNRCVRWLMIDKYQLRVLGYLWRAIDPITIRKGDKPAAQVRAVIEALKGGETVGIFPEGGLQRDHRNLQPFLPGVAVMAQRSGAWVVPVWISGTPRKKNLLLHLLWPSRSCVTFGKPYYVDQRAERDAVLEDLKQRMLALAGD